MIKNLIPPLLLLLLATAFPLNGATIGYDIVFNYTVTPTASQQATFEAAESTWESIITGYQDTVISSTVTIDVDLSPIDGPGGVLGSAGPSTAKVTPNFIYADTGAMTFDSADVASLEADGTFDDVVLHEMAHVLGIGTLWSSSSVGIPGRQELYVDASGEYTGVNGVAAYNEEFAQSGAFVPVELAGGAGTANGHWNEVDNGSGATGIISLITGQDFRNEIMTGWLNAPLYISNLSIASLQDIGLNTVALAQIPSPGMVPEPSIALTACLGLGLGLRRRRK